jgi:hypothetical protein
MVMKKQIGTKEEDRFIVFDTDFVDTYDLNENLERDEFPIKHRKNGRKIPS